MKKFDSAAPYIASFIILRRGTKVAMILRKNTNWMDGYYGLPAGKVEWGETFSLAVAREAFEEAGVKVSAKDIEFRHAAHRHIEDTDWVDMYFEANEWSGDPFNAEQHKSEELKWLDLSNLPENVVPSQRAALEHVVKGISYSEYGW